jgi:hypothetical protein
MFFLRGLLGGKYMVNHGMDGDKPQKDIKELTT